MTPNTRTLPGAPSSFLNVSPLPPGGSGEIAIRIGNPFEDSKLPPKEFAKVARKLGDIKLIAEHFKVGEWRVKAEAKRQHIKLKDSTAAKAAKCSGIRRDEMGRLIMRNGQPCRGKRIQEAPQGIINSTYMKGKHHG